MRTALVLTAVLSITTTTAAEPPRAILREGDSLGGNQTVRYIIGPHTNGGAAVVARVQAGPAPFELTDHLWGSLSGEAPGVLRSAGIVGDREVHWFHDSPFASESGSLFYGALSTYLPTLDQRWGVWRDDSVIVEEGESVPGLRDRVWDQLFVRHCSSDGSALVYEGTTLQPGSGIMRDRLLISTAQPEPLLVSGRLIPGLGVAMISGGGVIIREPGFSRSGDHFSAIVLVEELGIAMVVDGAAALAHGAPMTNMGTIPAASGGVPGERWGMFAYSAIDGDGHWVQSGDTVDGPAGGEGYLAWDGDIIFRAGQPIYDGTVIAEYSDVGDLAMNDDGDVVMYWRTMVDGIERDVLIVNGRAVLQSGDQVDWNGDGKLDAATFDRFWEGDSFPYVDPNTVAVTERDAAGRIAVTFAGWADPNGPGGSLPVRTMVQVPFDTTIEGLEQDGEPGVGLGDLIVVLANYGRREMNGLPGDVNMDGTVDFADIVAILAEWGS